MRTKKKIIKFHELIHLRMEIEKIISETVGKYWRSGVLTNLMILTAIVVTISFVLAFNTNDPILKYSFLAIGILVLFYTLYRHDYLLKNYPRLLHSEEFLAQDKYLDMIARKGEKPHLIEENKNIEPPRMLDRK